MIVLFTKKQDTARAFRSSVNELRDGNAISEILPFDAWIYQTDRVPELKPVVFVSHIGNEDIQDLSKDFWVVDSVSDLGFWVLAEHICASEVSAEFLSYLKNKIGKHKVTNPFLRLYRGAVVNHMVLVVSGFGKEGTPSFLNTELLPKIPLYERDSPESAVVIAIS